MFTPDDLPEVTEQTDEYGNRYVHAGEWSFDPKEDADPDQAWQAAKAWAAYTIWLEDRA